MSSFASSTNNFVELSLSNVCRYKVIGHKKEETPTSRLCTNMPKEFDTYLRYVKVNSGCRSEPLISWVENKTKDKDSLPDFFVADPDIF